MDAASAVSCALVLALTVGCGPAEPPIPVAATSRRPPSRPSTFVVGERRWFVMTRVHLGLSSRETMQRDPSAWKQYGFDLDRRATTREASKTSAGSCVRSPASGTTVLGDGVDGIDNNFGQHVMAVVKSLKSDAEEAANAEIAQGGYTMLLRIDGVARDNGSAPGALYAVGPHSGPPTFAADDRWPVWSSMLADGVDLEEPLRTFPLGYVRDGTWVSGEVGELPAPVSLPLFGVVTISASVLLTVELDSGRGLLAGALPTSAVRAAAATWAVRLGICPGDATFEQVTDTLTQSADLVIGAPDLQDTTRQCDAISIGLGFDVVPVSPPTTVVAPPPLAPSTCAADAGVESGP